MAHDGNIPVWKWTFRLQVDEYVRDQKEGVERSGWPVARKGISLGLWNFRVDIITLGILQIALDWRKSSFFLRRCLAADDLCVGKKLTRVKSRLAI
jgi:hypothetical protein